MAYPLLKDYLFWLLALLLTPAILFQTAKSSKIPSKRLRNNKERMRRKKARMPPLLLSW
jgi:hypothetical protein